uniref:Ig-like domain-containing protein n=1 Tax=Meleagris gallopavo TaxID=9103 RepID=A0A803YDW3_MELGA
MVSFQVLPTLFSPKENHFPIARRRIYGSDDISQLTVIEGSLIKCKAQGIPEPAVTWMKDGRPLVSGRDIAILHDGHFLQLRNIQVLDTGRYVCVAANVAGLSDRKYDLNVHVPPTITNSRKEVTVAKGSSASLKCFTDGTPAPAMSWFKNGHPLSLGAHQTLSNQGMVLHFVKAEIGDVGKYTCVASNKAGDVSKHFSLKVLGKCLPVG